MLKKLLIILSILLTPFFIYVVYALYQGEFFTDVKISAWWWCAASNIGKVYCWWGNTLGQVNPFSSEERLDMIEVPNISYAKEIISGYTSNCARTLNNEYYCWWDIQQKYVRDPEQGIKKMDTYHGKKKITKNITANYLCELDTNGDLECTWLKKINLSWVYDVETGLSQTCALKSDGTVWCWTHDNAYGIGSAQALMPTKKKGLTGVIEITWGSSHWCALKKQWIAFCWGE